MRKPDDFVRLLFDPARTIVVSPSDDSVICGCLNLTGTCLTDKEYSIVKQMIEAWLQTDSNMLCTREEAEVIWLKFFGNP